MKEGWRGIQIKLIVSGSLIGLAYGLFIRFGAKLFPNNSLLGILTLGSVLFVPLAMGFVSVFIVERRRPQPFWVWLLLPWMSVIALVLATVLTYLEGTICIVMFAPFALVAASVGGIAGGLIARKTSSHVKNPTLVAVMFLPFVINALEARLPLHQDLRVVENTIDIHASSAEVWRNIERVPKIGAAELPRSWSHAIGFPNPVEATLSAEGLGGVRHATFEGGVLFIETIDRWQPERSLGFSIRAQTGQIPPTTLDEHVTIGGKFFDVLHGEYTLEPRDAGVVRLHLASRHRIGTDFNWYAHLWTEAVMSDLQQRILFVIRDRAQAAMPSPQIVP